MTRLLLPLLVILAFPLHAQWDGQLQGEFWVEKQGLRNGVPETGVDASTRAARVLSEARTVFSGMIYGWSFSYSPLDLRRKVEESFRMDGLGSIETGDPDLEFREVRQDEALVYYRFRFFPDEDQASRLESRNSLSIPDAGGRGSAPLQSGPEGKQDAIRDACRDAVRNLARGMVRNKPAALTGRLYLSSIPYLRIESGRFQARVTVRIIVDEVLEYRSF